MSYSLSRLSFLPIILVAGALFFALPAAADACGAIDLVVKKSGPATVSPGQTVEYTVTVTQVASGKGTYPFVNDDFSSQLIPISQQPLQSSSYWCSTNGLRVVCRVVGPFRQNMTWATKYVFKVSPTAVCGSTIVNRVGAETQEPDTNPTNNQAQVSSLVVCPATPTPTPTPTPQCSDGIDNDTDGAIDMNDFSCSSPTDNDETNPKAQCQDGIDNDGDGLIDFGSDPGCSSQQDNDEGNATATPTSTPTPTPEPNKGIHVVKTDHREITRPGHTLTYVITVENTGNADMHDVAVKDTVPEKLMVTSIGQGGTRAGRVITWSGITLDAGAKKNLTVTAHVHEQAGNGHILVNEVKACSHDHDVCDEASDTTRVERLPQVISAQAPQPVAVTARTGAGSLLVSLASLMSGTVGFTYSSRRNK